MLQLVGYFLGKLSVVGGQWLVGGFVLRHSLTVATINYISHKSQVAGQLPIPKSV